MASKHGIRLPGLLLDELKSHDYDNDERFKQTGRTKGKKRAASQLGRKERRKQQRLSKKHSKRDKDPNVGQKLESKPVVKSKQTKARKEAKAPVKKRNNDLPFSSVDELSSGDFDEFDEEDLDEEEWEQLRELENDDEGDEGEPQMSEGQDDGDEDEDEDEEEDEEEEDIADEMSVEETMAALKALKEKKGKLKQETVHEDDDDDEGEEEEEEEIADEMSVEETMAALKAQKEKKGKLQQPEKPKKSNKRKSKESEEEIAFPMAPSDRAAAERDEMDMQYYAKKLGLKGKNKKIHARDEFDAVGGLLEGLDFFEEYGDKDEEYGEFGGDDGSSSDSQSEESDEKAPEGLPSSDDEISSGDFDEFDEDDLDEEEWQQLRELEGQDGSDEDQAEKSSGKTRKKPNPLVAPVAPSNETYVPPSMRKKQLENDQESATQAEVRKSVKSSLNKLSDSNITIIIGSLNDLFDKYARQVVTQAIVEQVVDIVAQRQKLLDSFIMNYSAVLFSLWKLRGIDIGASFIQLSVESFLGYFEEQNKNLQDGKGTGSGETPVLLSKEPVNLLTLIAYCYNFGLTSSRLVYDMIRLFVECPNELTTELLLKIISVSGSLIRGDDPAALKEIIAVLLSNVKNIENQPPRMKFLLDTVADLKNNRLKPSMLAASHGALKKKLQSVVKTNSSANDALLVSLDDIKNVESKGKWWLIGASWKGNMEGALEEAPEVGKGKSKEAASTVTLDDDLLDDIPDWSEIARQQRMNTDIRRAIFISIMSAQDFMDAFTKLEKLNLKNKQTIEIPKVLLHCLSQDGNNNGYNPYYSLLAKRLCENQQALVKSFQFLFWDTMKRFEDDGMEGDFSEDEDLDEDTKLKRVASQGKFFGFLIAERSLKLDILKHVSLISGLNADGKRFMEMLLFQMLLTSAKKSEVKSKDSRGKKIVIHKPDILEQLVDGVKPENKALILKGLNYFMKKSFKYLQYVVGSPGDKSYDRDLRRLNWSVPTFKGLIDEQLESIDI